MEGERDRPPADPHSDRMQRLAIQKQKLLEQRQRLAGTGTVPGPSGLAARPKPAAANASHEVLVPQYGQAPPTRSRSAAAIPRVPTVSVQDTPDDSDFFDQASPHGQSQAQEPLRPTAHPTMSQNLRPREPPSVFMPPPVQPGVSTRSLRPGHDPATSAAVDLGSRTPMTQNTFRPQQPQMSNSQPQRQLPFSQPQVQIPFSQPKWDGGGQAAHKVASDIGSEGASTSGRPATALICLGFGGRIATMHPRPSPLALPDGRRKLAPGPVNISSVQDLLQGTSVAADMAKLKCFPVSSAAAGKEALKTFIASRLDPQEQEEDGAVSQEVQLFWRIMRALLEKRSETPKAGPLQPKAESSSQGARLAELVASSSNVDEPSADLDATSPPIVTQTQARPDPAGENDVALQVQSLMLVGKSSEALRVAVEGQWWAAAFMIAHMLGDDVFRATSQQFAASQLHSGCPLTTLFCSPALPQGPLQEWRQSLAILLANQEHLPTESIQNLGDKLFRGNQAAPAQICYILGSVQPSLLNKTARLCLPLADHRHQTRTYASIDALQRGLCLEVVSQKGQKPNLELAVVMLPYHILYAASLAAHGLISEASQVCAGVTITFQGFAGKVPISLLSARNAANDLHLRLQNYASGLGIRITHAADNSMMRKASRWLDKGLSKLIGIPNDLPDAPDAGQGKLEDRPPTHRRSSSQSSVSQIADQMQPQSLQDSSRWHGPNNPQRQQAAPTAHTSPAPVETAEGPSSASPGLSVRGIMNRVGSLSTFLTGPAGPKADEGPAIEENKLYYDNELKLWRVKGEPPPKAAEAVGPPPTILRSPARAGSGVLPPPGSRPPPQSETGKAPTMTPPGRYVDTLASTGPPGRSVPSIPGEPRMGLVQQQSVPFPAKSAPQQPGATKFFVPSRGPASAAPQWGKGDQ